MEKASQRRQQAAPPDGHRSIWSSRCLAPAARPRERDEEAAGRSDTLGGRMRGAGGSGAAALPAAGSGPPAPREETERAATGRYRPRAPPRPAPPVSSSGLTRRDARVEHAPPPPARVAHATARSRLCRAPRPGRTHPHRPGHALLPGRGEPGPLASTSGHGALTHFRRDGSRARGVWGAAALGRWRPRSSPAPARARQTSLPCGGERGGVHAEAVASLP